MIKLIKECYNYSMDNNFQPQNFENQNVQPQTPANFQPEAQPSIEMPSEPAPAKPKNKLKIPLIILIILTVGSLTFGVFEFLQNSTLKSEVSDLKAKIETLEKTPIEPEPIPTEKLYSGTLEYNFSNNNEPTTTYDISLNYESGELLLTRETCGALADGPSCSGDEYSVVLTEKELKKVWWITRDENYNQEALTEALDMIAVSSKSETTEDGEVTNCTDGDITNCQSIDYRATGNSMLDDLLYEIYGKVACDHMPTTCDAEIEECEKRYDPTTFNCQTAQEVDYPYIEDVY